MSKYLRKEKARGSPIYMSILDKCADELALHGVFRKDKVLDELALDTVSDAIRWDYIREFLEDEQGCEMVPLAEAYFKRHGSNEERINPQKFIAMGHGKKTAGYASVSHENDHLFIARIEHKRMMSNGVGKAFEEFASRVAQKRLELGIADGPKSLTER